MPFLKFTVDSRLLEELGERLVGKPYIALAELVKNSYDADATEVTIELDPKNDLIRIVDNGQGMTFEEFETFWMRVGSTHKQRQEISKSLRQFKRPLTGSKGIGRLAVQYLAGELTILSTSEKDRTRRIEAHVKWEEAVSAGELTQSRVQYDIKTSKEFPIRTSIVLTKLKQKWDQSSVKGLAKEIWWLRPAFSRDSGGPAETEGSFTIGFTSPNPEFKDFFERQMQAILDIWYAKLLGRNNGGVVALTLEFAGKDRVTIDYSIPPPCRLKDGSFEIRIYKLEGKLRGGLKIGDVRQYLAEFGGVHVYDSGFHLPYYGKPENDWLRVEFDHSHRLSISALLPGPLQVEGGMSYLPTLSRILGVVNVNTSKDRGLQILITRDRFQESVALGNLVYMVRWALDFYAIQEANKIERSLELAKDTEKPKYRRIEDVLAH
jgi:hypothetical protein